MMKTILLVFLFCFISFTQDTPDFSDNEADYLEELKEIFSRYDANKD